MPEDTAFADLLRRVRAGDQEAASQLVRQHEDAIRRVVRFQLRDSRLRRQLDSIDVCQSVLGSFFVRAALGQYELDGSEQLGQMLATMVRNKRANEVERQQAPCRDYRRTEPGGLENVDLAAGGASPSAQVA